MLVLLLLVLLFHYIMLVQFHEFLLLRLHLVEPQHLRFLAFAFRVLGHVRFVEHQVLPLPFVLSSEVGGRGFS